MNRRPLGRGLDALIERAAPANAQPAPPAAPQGAGGGLQTAAPSEIAPSPFQPRRRFDVERLHELTRAIQSQGIIEPLIVRPLRTNGAAANGVRFELIAGERRLRAARAAELEIVPIIVRQLDDRAALEMSLVENLSREDLNAVEEASALKRLAGDFALSHDDIAIRIGKSRPYVSNAIRLLDLPEPVLDMIAGGELTVGQARPLLALQSAQAQMAAARRVVEQRITARGAEALAGTHRKKRRGRTSNHSGADANVTALAEGLQRAFKRKVRIIQHRGKQPGRIEFDFYDDNDLTALTAVMLQSARSAP
ncbi:MAG: ParB/RepB/Spo0J family partition protein, partial [Candidatus Binataceae bacterium]